MQNFVYSNPVKIVFGKRSIGQLGDLLPHDARVLITYGGGSIKRNGVYDQVVAALAGRTYREFPGIEPNPTYETCMRAAELVRGEKISFLLAVGGGSVLDGTKFIAAAAVYDAGDPWEILSQNREVKRAVPLGSVMTLPATGSEMNTFAVISRASTHEKLAFASPHVYPQFSILDPETTYSLPARQVANGIVDTFVHVAEQYATVSGDVALQDRQSEAIIQTLIEQAPRLRQNPNDYDVRANLVWCATQALNGVIGLGVSQDWSTHMIGHELTAFYGIDHAQSLAVVLPAIWRYKKATKGPKLAQYARRVWNLSGSDDAVIDQGIERTRQFFEQVGIKTRLSDYGIDAREAGGKIAERFAARSTRLGERQDITGGDIPAILELCR